MSKKLGLALGGGGARGVVHVGFLKALEEEGITPYCISGTSMGAIVGGCYAAGMPVDKMRDILLSLKTSDIVDIDVLMLMRLSMLRGKKLQKLFVKHLGETTFAELKMPYTCTAVDLYTGKLYIFKEGSLAKAVLASSCVPGVFRPVEHEDMLLVDGGVLCRVPVRQTKELGADVVVGIDAIKNTAEPVTKVSNLIGMAWRVFEIVDNAIVQHERSQSDYPCDLMLEPEMKGVSQFEVKGLEQAYNEGYQLGKDNAEKIRGLIAD